MASDGEECFLDSSVLINFLNLDRADLLGLHPTLRFVITPHVRDEVTQNFPRQKERLQAALEAGWIGSATVSGSQELAEFHALLQRRLGVGESAVIAVGVVRGTPIALDDVKAQREARTRKSDIQIATTKQILLDHIHAGSLSIAAADEIKGVLETTFRFRFKGFVSFGELV